MTLQGGAEESQILKAIGILGKSWGFLR
jgi:hypothetical protein